MKGDALELFWPINTRAMRETGYPLSTAVIPCGLLLTDHGYLLGLQLVRNQSTAQQPI